MFFKMEKEHRADPEHSGEKIPDGSGTTRFQMDELKVSAGINRWIDERNSICLIVLWMVT